MSKDDLTEGSCWMLDLDGVLWLGDEPIPGAVEAVKQLGAIGARVVYFTNNSFVSRADMLGKFARFGLDVSDEDLLSSGQAASQLMQPGERAFVLGGEGIVEALTKREVAIDHEGDDVDAVVVGLDRDLHFERLTMATRHVYRGARLIGTNDDATYPTADGPLPGGGALLAAVAYATGKTPVVAGKPNQPAVDLVAERIGRVDVMVGDRPSTDGLFGHRIGARYALVRSGVTAPGATPEDPPAEFDAPDLGSFVADVLGKGAAESEAARR